jgi:hypothetical protein
MERKNSFIEILYENPIDMKKLRDLSFKGIPDDFP